MNKVFNNDKSSFCFIIALICLWFQYKNSDYKFILLFSVLSIIGSFSTANICRIILISLTGAFSLTYLTNTLNANLVIKEGLASPSVKEFVSPSVDEFVECYPVGEQDAKYIEDAGYEVAVDTNGSITVTDTVTSSSPSDTGSSPDLKTQLNDIVNSLLSSSILAFIIGAGTTYLVYMAGKRVWDNSIKSCINRPKI